MIAGFQMIGRSLRQRCRASVAIACDTSRPIRRNRQVAKARRPFVVRFTRR
uniref:hypothetical protein n=1 Tax=Sphingomonas sp. TaxID=28214 RepID=UPI0025DA7D21|nr:hypothetical protein [Sphingomonas sp.]